MNAILKSENLELHPLCSLFPRMSGAEFESLREDIKANGLRNPIVVHGGMILDGGNRYRACLEAGVEPSFEEFSGDNLVSYVLSVNLHRRHMTPGQQAAIVASATDWAKTQTQGRPKIKPEGLPVLSTVASRAAASGATERTQRDADKLVREEPELAKQVTDGTKSLYQAVKETKPKKAPKPKVVADPEPAPPSSVEAPDPLAPAREHAKKQSNIIRGLRKELVDNKLTIEALQGQLSEARDNAYELATSLEAYATAEAGVEESAKEIKRLNGMIKVIASTRDQYMTQVAEMKRTIGARDRKIAKLENPS